MAQRCTRCASCATTSQRRRPSFRARTAAPAGATPTIGSSGPKGPRLRAAAYGRMRSSAPTCNSRATHFIRVFDP
eukprot:1711650-Prymnesium_polylepis.1